MRKKILTVLCFLFALVLGLSVLAACGDAEGDIELGETSFTFAVGETHNLTATAKEGGDITWTTSDESVVSIQMQVASRGIVMLKAEKAGTATITATSQSGKTATCTATVENITVDISGTGVADGKLQMERYSTTQLTATVKRDGQPMSDGVRWTSSDESIVTVSTEGKLEALKPGNAVITATRVNSTVHSDLNVTVVWTEGPTGWYELHDWEQNKITPNLWGYWVDAGYEGANVKVTKAEYLGDPTGTGLVAGGVTVTYENQNDVQNEHGMQLFYRSSKAYNDANKDREGFEPYNGKLLLEVNTHYLLKMDITVTASGTITVNGTQVDVVANQKQSIEIPFNHTDDGRIHADGDWANVSSAVYLMMGANNTMIQAATVTIENVSWEPWDGSSAKLKTPTLSVSGKNVTITDPNAAGVKNYTVGLFEKDAEEGAEPVRMVTSTAKTFVLDDSKWPNGEYELRVRANGKDLRYSDSEWSAGVDHTVSHGAVQYDLTQGTSAQAKADLSDTYYYYTEGATVETATYNDGVITLKYSGNSSWTAMQIFYKNPSLTNGTKYTLTFKLNSPLAGKIRINGNMFDLVEGNNDIELSYTEGSDADGLSMNIQFGEPTSNYSGTASVLTEGTFTLSNIEWNPYVAPEGSIPEGAEADAVNHPGTFYLWSDHAEWNGANVTVSSNSIDYENKTISFSYTSEGDSKFGAGVQLFYEHPGVVDGKVYTITLTIKVSVTCDIRVCGQVEHFEANVARTLTITQAEPGNAGQYKEGATIAVLMGTYESATSFTNVKAAEVTITNWSVELSGETLSVPENFDIGADKKVTFTDTKNEDATYELGFFKKADDTVPFVTLPIANGDTIDNAKLFAGTYTVKVRAVKEGANTSDWSQGKEYTVTKAASEATDLQWGEEFGAVSSDGRWIYWTDDQNPDSVEVEYVRFYEENGKYRIAVKESAKKDAGSLSYGFQMFHNDTANYTKGKDYVLTVTVKSKAAMKIQLYGKEYQIPGGEEETPLSVRFTLTYGTANNYTDVSLFDFCVPQTVGTTYEFELKDIAWKEAGDDDYTLGEDILPSTTAMVHSGKEDDAHVLDTFLYWYVAEEGWQGCGTAVTMKQNTYENGKITLGYAGGSVAFSVQLFYCNSHLDTTKEYLLSTTITSTKDLNITVNNKPVTLEANKAQEVKVAFTPATKQLENKAPWAVDIQLPGVNGDATVTFEGLKWNEILGSSGTTPSTPESGGQGGTQPSTPTDGTQMTKLASKDGSDLVKGKWSYYAADNVTVKTATVSADGKTVTVTVSGLAKWDDVTIFFTPEAYNDGDSHTIIADYLFTSSLSGACNVTLNNCTAGGSTVHKPGYTYGTPFNGQGLPFTVTGGIFYNMTIGQDTGGAGTFPNAEVTITLSNITLA